MPGYYIRLSLGCVSLGRKRKILSDFQKWAKNCGSEALPIPRGPSSPGNPKLAPRCSVQATLLRQTAPCLRPPSKWLPSLTNGIRGSHTLDGQAQRGPDPTTEGNSALHSRSRDKGCFLWEQEMAVCWPVFVRALFSPDARQSSS